MASNHVYLKGGGQVVDDLFNSISDCWTDDRDLRIMTGTDGAGNPWVKWKVGEGQWSPPMYSDHDPNRD